MRTLLAFGVFVGITRGALEQFLFGIAANGSDILAYIPFYISLPFIYSALLSALPGIQYIKTLQPVTFASILGLLPPILDYIFSSTETHKVFYGYFLIHDLREFPWLGYNPQQNYSLGEAVTIWLTFIFASLYVYSRTRNFILAVCAFFLAYVAYILYALAIPMGISFILFGYVPHRAPLEAMGPAPLRQGLFVISAVQVFIAWLIDTTFTGALKTYLKRSLHILPFVLLVILGAIQGHATFFSTSFVFSCILLVGFTIIAQNDLRENNNIQNHIVPTANALTIIFCVMLLFAGMRFSLIGFALIALAILYHYKFFNARKTLLGSMKIEGAWAFLSYLMGLMAGKSAQPSTKIIITGALIFGGFSLFSLIKDAKDIDDDTKENRITLYTYVQKQGWSTRTLHGFLVLALVLGLIIVALFLRENAVSFLIHTILSLVTIFAAVKAFHKIGFQLFLLALAAVIINLIVHEYLMLNRVQ
ncbi:MAG TPA: hypothetical protein PLY93_10550 [Turneriella sp.]|nr:hypothetical protein [Turneriella sp.]